MYPIKRLFPHRIYVRTDTYPTRYFSLLSWESDNEALDIGHVVCYEVPESVDSYLKSEDATDYLEVIQAWDDRGFTI